MVTNGLILISEPLMFKKFTMLSVTEQLFISKSSGDQNPSAKHHMSGGYVGGSGSSLDDMTGSGRQNKGENEAVRYLSIELVVAFESR